MQNSVFYRPLAVLLSFIMLPWIAFISGSRSSPFQAKGQVVTSCDGSGLIKNLCAGTSASSTPGQISQFETTAINNWLDAHSLPHDNTIFDYGRLDLRNELKSFLLASLVGIIQKPAAQRTAEEQAVFTWFQANLQQWEIKYYTAAINEWNKFLKDPCNYQLDLDIAQQYNINWSSDPFCYQTPLSTAFGMPPVPAANYFLAVGLKNSYGAALSANGEKGSATAYVAGSVIDITKALNLSLGVAAGTGAAAGLSSAASASLIFPQTLGYAANVADGVITGSRVVSTTTSVSDVLSDVGPAVEGITGVGVAAIVFAAVAIGIQAGIQQITNGQQIDQLNALRGILQTIQSTAPDLATYLNDDNSRFRLTATLTLQTLPDTPSTAALPQPSQGPDLELQISAQNGSVMQSSPATYIDWVKRKKSIATWRPAAANSPGLTDESGYFLLSDINSDGSTTAPSSLTPTIFYLDWNGNQMVASRNGAKFLVTRQGSSLPTCPAGPYSQLSTQDPFGCSAFVTDTLQLQDATGQNVSLRLVGPPVFTSPARFSTPINTTGIATITVESPTPVLRFFVTDAFPQGVQFSNVNANQVQLTYRAGVPMSNQITLFATNSYGTTTQTVLLTSYGNLAFTSVPPPIVANNGTTVRYQVVTNGGNSATLTGANFDAFGLALKDNRDGTATISGTLQNLPSPAPCNSLAQPCPVVTASNGQTSINTTLSLQAAPPPPVPIQAFTGTFFTPGQSSSAPLKAPNTLTGITDLSYSGSLPPGLSLSLVNGQVMVTGTPVVGSDGSYPLTVVANGISYTTTINVGIEINPQLSATSAVFWLGQNNSFTLNATGNPSPNIQFTAGAIPPGVTTKQTYSSVTFSGTPTTAGSFVSTWFAGNTYATSNSNFTIYVELPGDVNGDGVVDCKDYDAVKQSLGLAVGQAGFNAAADFNSDGLITIEDLVKEARQLSGSPVCH